MPTIVDQADAAITGLLAEARRNDGPIDLAPHARRVTMAVVVQALFGQSVVGPHRRAQRAVRTPPGLPRVARRPAGAAPVPVHPSRPCSPGPTQDRCDRRRGDRAPTQRSRVRRERPADGTRALRRADGRGDPGPGRHADRRRLRHHGGVALMDRVASHDSDRRVGRAPTRGRHRLRRTDRGRVARPTAVRRKGGPRDAATAPCRRHRPAPGGRGHRPRLVRPAPRHAGDAVAIPRRARPPSVASTPSRSIHTASIG